MGDPGILMINGSTGLVGLLGNPVTHSLSPVMQNAALRCHGPQLALSDAAL